MPVAAPIQGCSEEAAWEGSCTFSDGAAKVHVFQGSDDHAEGSRSGSSQKGSKELLERQRDPNRWVSGWGKAVGCSWEERHCLSQGNTA